MKGFFLLLCSFFVAVGSAQSFDCKQGMQDYQTLFKAKKIDEAYTVWSAVRRNCEKDYVGVYEDGFLIAQAAISRTKPLEEKERMVRDVLKLYDEYHTYFPAKAEDYEVGKAMMMYYNSIRAKQQMDEIFSLLEHGFTMASDKVKDSNAINLYFDLCYGKFKAKELSAEVLTEKYFLLTSLLNRLQEEYPTNIKAYKTVRTKMDGMAKPVLSCSGLTAYYEKGLAANKDNSKWLEEALGLLSTKCAATPIYTTLAGLFYAKGASVTAASFRAIGALKQRKYAEASTYFDEAIALEPLATKKASLCFFVGTQLAGVDKGKAKDYFTKALQFDGKMAKAYLSLAQLYCAGIKECGGTDFDAKVVYYLALQTANKASATDPKQQPQVSKFVDKYAKEALTAKEIRKAKLAGTAYTVGCWIATPVSFMEE